MNDVLVRRASERGISVAGRIELWNEKGARHLEQMELLRAHSLVPLVATAPPLVDFLVMGSAKRTIRPSEPSSRDWGARRAVVERLDVGRMDVPLLGVKDMIDVVGRACELGTTNVRRPRATTDAPAVARLRAAGLHVSCMLNQHALAYGATGLSSGIGPAINALDPDVLPGGSSSGCGVAVGSGLVEVALGTDTGGSIRIPAALNGVVGFKPTYGAVPMEGVAPLAPTLDHVGPVARTVHNAAAAFSVLSSPMKPHEGLRLDDDESIVVGVARGGVFDDLDEATEEKFDSVLADWSRSGRVELVELDIAGADVVRAAQLSVLSTEALNEHGGLLARGEPLPADVRLRLELGLFVEPEDYGRGLGFCSRWRAVLESAFRECHVLISPTLAVYAPRVDTREVALRNGVTELQEALTRLTSPFNLSGHPAISLPVDMDGGSVPLGIQIVGPLGRDDRTLAVAERVEAELGASTRENA